MARLKVVSGGAGGESWELIEGKTMVMGRDPACDFTIDNPDVSRRHAEFNLTPQGVLVKDLGSTNGILVNGAKVAEKLLANGDRVKLGGVLLELDAPHVAKTQVAGTRVSSTSVGGAVALVDASGSRLALNKQLTVVGREKGCDLVLAQESVSARHAELRLTPQGLLVKDLGSTNGTFVNGKRVNECLVRNGDQLAFDIIKYKVSVAGGAAGTQVRAEASATPPPVPGRSRAAGKSNAGMVIGILVALVLVAWPR